MSTVPDQIGRFAVQREIGRGGKGIVYRGHDARLDRRVAIEVLPAEPADDPRRPSRFEREARVLASPHHSDIAGGYGLEEVDGVRDLIMEHVDGEGHDEILRRGPIPVRGALERARRTAVPLEAAHESGIVHRELTPGTVRVTPGVRFAFVREGANEERSPDMNIALNRSEELRSRLAAASGG